MFMQDFTQSATIVSIRQHASATAEAMPKVVTGFVGGTHVETDGGWRPAEFLKIGDRVHTLDGGLATVQEIDRRILMPSDDGLIHVPGGRFDTCDGGLLMPEQWVVLDTAGDPELEDDLFVCIKAQELVGHLGARHTSLSYSIEVVTPLFTQSEAVYAQSGMLLHCPSIFDGYRAEPGPNFFTRLQGRAAQDFLTRRSWRLAA